VDPPDGIERAHEPVEVTGESLSQSYDRFEWRIPVYLRPSLLNENHLEKRRDSLLEAHCERFAVSQEEKEGVVLAMEGSSGEEAPRAERHRRIKRHMRRSEVRSNLASDKAVLIHRNFVMYGLTNM